MLMSEPAAQWNYENENENIETNREYRKGLREGVAKEGRVFRFVLHMYKGSQKHQAIVNKPNHDLTTRTSSANLTYVCSMLHYNSCSRLPRPPRRRGKNCLGEESQQSYPLRAPAYRFNSSSQTTWEKNSRRGGVEKPHK